MEWPELLYDAHHATNTKKKRLPLYSYSEIPHFMQGNPYVVHGYRAFLSNAQCIKSLCKWSNETINVWTHAIGFFVFLGLAIYDNLVMLPSYQGTTFLDHVIYTAFLSCFQFCMFASTGYHIFSGGSELVYKRWFSVDLAGISVGILGCYLSGIYYAFYCAQFWRNVYLLITVSLIVVTMLVQTHPRFLTSQWFFRRILLFSSLVGFGVAPTLHWALLFGGINTPIVKMLLPRVFMVYLLGFTALIFYATRFPEVCCPGKVDFIGNSHQLWHILVVMAFLWWHQTGVIMMDQIQRPNPCQGVFLDPHQPKVVIET